MRDSNDFAARHNHMTMASNKTAGVILLALVLAGCGSAPEAVVTGTVLVDGELAERGQVAFYPESEGPPALATIREDGSFAIAVGRGDKINPDKSKIVAGDYIVTVTVNGANVPDEEGGPPAIGPRISDEKYASRVSSPLRQSIVDGPNLLVFDLDRAAPAAAAEENVAEEDVIEETDASGESSDTANEGQDPEVSDEGDDRVADAAPPAVAEAEEEVAP
ncbi:MAG: hypothetical protein AAF805_01620 [Planctomycetota bacterium]